MSLRSKRELHISKNDELPEGWTVRRSKSRNKNFYFNKNTGASTWTKPQKTVTDDRTSSIKAQCSRTGEALTNKTPLGTLPKPLSLPGSSKQEKYQSKLEKTLSLPTIENVAKKVSFSFKQRSSLQKPSCVFSNNPSTSKSTDKSCNKNDRNCHVIISGSVTKGNKYRRKTKSLEANVGASSSHIGENSRAAMQPSGSSIKKVTGYDVKLDTQSPLSSQPVNEKYHTNTDEKSKPQLSRKRHSFPHLKSATSSKCKLTQEELRRRYDRTHPCKVIKPEKEDDVLLGKRAKEERTSCLKFCTAAVPHKDREEIDMEWEDIENEKVLLNIQEHRQQFQETKNENFSSPPVDMEVKYFDFSDNENKDCVIVLDTNVLISDVKFVERLIDNDFKDIGHPTLVIPWMVLKELDALKGKSVYNNSVLERNARRAIQFIHQCFNSHNPWVKGQSAVDDKEECFKVDSPDDSILNCCLQLHHKNKKVILLSNDINLCNKAIANGVRSFGKQQLEEKLLHKNFGLLFVAENTHGNETSCHQGAMREKSSLGATKNEREQPRNEIILSKFKSLLHQFLSKLLETEMKSVYEGMWLKIVYLKPPWSLLDVLQCFSKHWCAVFCFVIDNPAKTNIEKLITFFRKSFSGQSIKDVENVIISAISLCNAINSKKYSGLASEFKNQFQALLKEDHKVGVTTESQGLASSSSLPSYDNIPDNCGAAVVFEAFQIALSLANNFCGILCDVLGVPFEIAYDKPERLISWEELKERLPTVSKCLEDLTCSMRSVLEVPECHLTMQHPALMSLHASLLAVIPPDNQIVGAISCERLHSFAIEANTRMMLSNGLSQFINYQLLLAKVINGDINR